MHICLIKIYVVFSQVGPAHVYLQPEHVILTCRNCLLGKHLSKAKNLVFLDEPEDCKDKHDIVLKFTQTIECFGKHIYKQAQRRAAAGRSRYKSHGVIMY